jgi:hypothetical protein
MQVMNALRAAGYLKLALVGLALMDLRETHMPRTSHWSDGGPAGDICRLEINHSRFFGPD